MKYLIITISFISLILSQEKKDDNWISVAGKSEKQVMRIIFKEIEKQKAKGVPFVEREKDKLEESNEDKKISFQGKKIELRKKLNQSSNLKETAEIELINSKDNYNSVFSDFSATELQIAIIDSSIIENKKLISARKKEAENELSMIPLYDFIVSIAYDTEGKSYKAAMDYLSAKKAIENKLGFDIIESTLIKNGVISDQRIQMMLSGKVNLDLSTSEITNKQDDGTFLFDQIRYGKVKVYPFQAEDNMTLKTPKNLYNKKINAYSLITEEKKSYDIISKLPSASEKLKIKRFALEIQNENIESNSRISELARKTRTFIKNRETEIGKSQSEKKILSLSLERFRTELATAFEDTISKKTALNKILAVYNSDNERYSEHIYSERYYFVEKTSSERIESEDIDDQYEDLSKDIYKMFISNVKTQIYKEQNEVDNGVLTDFEGSLKASPNLYAIKVIGKTYSPGNEDRNPMVGLSLAFDYGFKFKELESLNKKPKPLFSRRKPDSRKKTTKQPNLESIINDSTKVLGHFSLAFEKLTFNSLDESFIEYPGSGIAFGFAIYDYNPEMNSKVNYSYSLNRYELLDEFRTDGEFYNSIYGDYVAHVSHNIEYGKIFFTESFDKSGSFNPVLGMGYSFSYFQLRNDSPSEYNSTSSTQGFYYFIELMRVSVPYGLGITYRSKLDTDKPQYWNTLSFKLSFVW